MPTTLRLLLLLMLGMFGLQPVSYGYDAPGSFVSGAQNIVAPSPETGAVTAEIAASVPLNFSPTRAAWDNSESIGLISNFVAAESGLPATTTEIVPFYPANNGFLGATERTFLTPGTTIDRYGGSGFSRFFSPAGTPAAARALPPGVGDLPLQAFQVMKPFEVESGTVAPALGQLGLGQQYMTPVNLDVLLKRGILQPVTQP